MLKRNLVKAGFFGHGALFIAISPFGANLKATNHQETLAPNVMVFAAAKDTCVVPEPDSSSTTPVAIVEAPQIRLNATATKYVKGFLVKNREDLQEAEKRSPACFGIIEPVFTKYGIPLELKYLAVVESQLKSSAVSRVGAKGPWQLMAVTARELGLKVKGKTDERTHYYKSTVAAAKYLKSLHGEFGDWLLVVAAYNSGSGTVAKAIKRSGSRNFWRLQAYLPAETRGHVKRFIGTHCYFQDAPSVTILTRAEEKEYLKQWAAFQTRQSLLQAREDTIIAAMQ